MAGGVAGEAVGVGGNPAEEEPAAGSAAAATTTTKKQKQRRGIVSRVWRGIFGGWGLRSEDFEKRLQHLSKEEASVLARLQRRDRRSRRMVRNFIVLSVLVEVVAVVYAIMTTRSLDLSWQMRAFRVLPMFILPVLFFAIYSTLVSFKRMRDHKDQRTLEKLRAERKAKIDELKERTNYYTTQQLIQKYDLDPAAKAAAATVLASKLGADSGLNVYVGEESQRGVTTFKGGDIEPTKSEGLRNRKHSHARSNHSGRTVASQLSNDISSEIMGDGQESLSSSQKIVEHYRGSGSSGTGWIARVAALLVGEDPSQCYALICGNCHMHNGLARKEDFPHIKYYCPHCNALNMSQQAGGSDLGYSSGITGSHVPTNLHNAVIPSERTDKKADVDHLPVVPSVEDN